MNKFSDKIITGFFVFIFAILWFGSTQYYVKTRVYHVKGYDVFGKVSNQSGIRTEFSTPEVAISYMEEYKKSFPGLKFTIQPEPLEMKRRVIIGKILSRDHK